MHPLDILSHLSFSDVGTALGMLGITILGTTSALIKKSVRILRKRQGQPDASTFFVQVAKEIGSDLKTLVELMKFNAGSGMRIYPEPSYVIHQRLISNYVRMVK